MQILNNKMARSKKQIPLPKFQHSLEKMGENIKLARKRRDLTTIQVSERAGIDRATLHYIKNGNPSVAIRYAHFLNDFVKQAWPAH